MALPDHSAGPEFFELYRRWAASGIGLCITGNIMIDSRHLGEAGNIVIERECDIGSSLKQWAKAKENTRTKLWAQLNHPGKQSPKFLNEFPVAPSSISLRPPLDKIFNKPRELTDPEIQEIIKRFAYAAGVIKASGFDGVQIHGAHGYLVSQFLSPKDNKRSDQWGGSLENRIRFPVSIYQAIRNEVGNEFPIGIKLNSADFQKGGFAPEESIHVAEKLSAAGMDLIELSGGSYEKPAMMGVSDSTVVREAYFLEYAKAVKNHVKCPLMVTGGFRTQKAMSLALETGEIDLVGLARPLALEPMFAKDLLHSVDAKSEVKPITTGVRFLDRLLPLEIIWYTRQLHRMGLGQEPKKDASAILALLASIFSLGFSSLKRVRR